MDWHSLIVSYYKELNVLYSVSHFVLFYAPHKLLGRKYVWYQFLVLLCWSPINGGFPLLVSILLWLFLLLVVLNTSTAFSCNEHVLFHFVLLLPTGFYSSSATSSSYSVMTTYTAFFFGKAAATLLYLLNTFSCFFSSINTRPNLSSLTQHLSLLISLSNI